MTSPGRYSLPETSEPPAAEHTAAAAPARRSAARLIRLALLVALMALLLWLGLKAWRVAQAARSLLNVQEQLPALLENGPMAVDPDAAEALVFGARADIVTLRDELGFARSIAPHLGWVPRLGPSLVAAPYLLDMADAGSEAAALAVGSLKPALAVVQQEGFGANQVGELLPTLAAAAPSLETANAALDRLAAARAGLAAAVPSEQLPWRVRQLLELSDEWLPLGQDGLRLAPHLPELLGANGPRRYLLMAQNEDEVRPTGGFLAGAGVVTVENGRIVALDFQDANFVDNFAEKPYDFPPQPLYDFMRLEMFLFRDANYWPDFPTSARKAMDLYAYGQDVPPLDGAVAIDQEFLRLLVDATGPVAVPGSDQRINAGNLVSLMREARGIQEGQEVYEWVLNRKAFLSVFADAIRAKIETDFANIDAVKLARNMTGAAEERHLSIFVRDEAAADALARTGWDGRLPQAPPGDFLMAVDTNLGYNKVNVLVERDLGYHVDLTGEPAATATIRYRHTGQALAAPCFQGVGEAYELAAAYEALINFCYYNYVRLYAPSGSVLLDSSRHVVPGETLYSGASWDSRAQQLVEQPGLTTFANFMLVPRASEAEAVFHYQLPAGVVVAEDDASVYRLTVYKQPGTRPEPLRLSVALPPDASLIDASLPVAVDGNVLTLETTLTTNLVITLRYR